MKILMVSPYSWARPGGVNSHIKGLSRELLSRGHRISIIAPDGKGEMDGIEILNAGKSIPVPSNGSIARIALSPLVFKRVRSTLENGYDVIHVHEPLVPFVSIASVIFSDSRTVGTFHSSGSRSVPYGFAKITLKGVHEKLDCLIAVSDASRRFVSKYFPGDYKVIPNGVDTGLFFPRETRPSGFAGAPSILFLGRNEPRKGFSTLLEAFKIVLREIDCFLVVVGSGFDSRSLEKDFQDKILIAGELSDEELPSYISASNVLCAPSLGGESFGIVLLEAMACGTPVVASDIAGYCDVVKATGGGILFRKGNASELASSLIRVLKHENLRNELKGKAISGANEFSWKKLAIEVEKCYQQDL
ncbi:MAG: glycosyltransferase family 4 protein [Actinomycetota bacterium]|nr:glycosyltransferase family 4 protein [Actinomycetota bacterium]